MSKYIIKVEDGYGYDNFEVTVKVEQDVMQKIVSDILSTLAEATKEQS